VTVIAYPVRAAVSVAGRAQAAVIAADRRARRPSPTFSNSTARRPKVPRREAGSRAFATFGFSGRKPTEGVTLRRFGQERHRVP
jgi:hypothetical protein